jgi:hypothetical protein
VTGDKDIPREVGHVEGDKDIPGEVGKNIPKDGYNTDPR